MDISETYVKMVCVLPEEFWKNFRDDILTPQVCSHCRKFVMDRRVACCHRMNRFPAPRQDQLQEMTGYNVHDNLHKFYLWIQKDWSEKQEEFLKQSMEQLLLAFVLKEKYGRVWNGEDWVRERGGDKL